MIRLSTLLWLATVIVVGYAMFQVKYEVMQQETELGHLDHQIADGREAIRVLNAEWSFLSQPTRLDDLAKRYLTLAPIGTAQLLANLDALPMRAAAMPSAAATTVSESTAPALRPTSPARAGTRFATLKASVER